MHLGQGFTVFFSQPFVVISKPELSHLSNMLDYDVENSINTIKEQERYLSGHFKPRPRMEFENNNTADNVAAPNGSDSIARKRWSILAKALKTHGNNNAPADGGDSTPTAMAHNSSVELPVRSDDLRVSVRRFGSFDLMQQDHLSVDSRDQLVGSSQDWFTYRLDVGSEEFCVNIHHINRPITATDLMGFNNTGNICVWPSEEALAFYTLTDINSFTNKMVLELGGGMTCLAGLLVAKYGRPYGVHLTDGNRMSVDNVRKTCRLNDIHNCYVKCSVLKWELNREPRDGMEKFDYILSADCLFFDEARPALVDTMWAHLSASGTALVMAPRRGTTLDAFVASAKAKGFRCEVVERYNDAIWQRHLELKAAAATGGAYDENIHYPILIKLNK